MSVLRALTIRQPHASLVAEGAKTIETRGFATSYRGPLLVHAGKALPPTDDYEQGCDFGTIYNADASWSMQWAKRIGEPDSWHYYVNGDGPHRLPLGAVVASCELIDCVPIYDGTDRSMMDLATVAPCVSWDGDCGLYLLRAKGWPGNDLIDDQLPFGDFSPGRYAWLLGDVKPTTERCPRCWGSGAVPLFDVVRRGYDDPERTCPTCSGGARCAPVSMRGRQGLWTPTADDWATRD